MKARCDYRQATTDRQGGVRGWDEGRHREVRDDNNDARELNPMSRYCKKGETLARAEEAIRASRPAVPVQGSGIGRPAWHPQAFASSQLSTISIRFPHQRRFRPHHRDNGPAAIIVCPAAPNLHPPLWTTLCRLNSRGRRPRKCPLCIAPSTLANWGIEFLSPPSQRRSTLPSSSSSYMSS